MNGLFALSQRYHITQYAKLAGAEELSDSAY
jgi:hypothetical protein